MREWQGKRYWLVGASEGLGRDVAHVMSRAGAEVILSARSAERLTELAAELPGKSSVVPLDVTDNDAVQAAAVVAMPHEKWGEVPCAFVELRDGLTATSEDIIAFCRSHLAGFKAPKAVVFDTLPKTSTGKIQKFQLRDRAKAM